MTACGQRTYGELIWTNSTTDGSKKARPCIRPAGHEGSHEGRPTPDELEARHAGGVRRVRDVPVGWYVCGVNLAEPGKYVRVTTITNMGGPIRLFDGTFVYRDYAPTDRVLVMSPEEADQARYVRDEAAEQAAENRHL